MKLTWVHGTAMRSGERSEGRDFARNRGDKKKGLGLLHTGLVRAKYEPE